MGGPRGVKGVRKPSCNPKGDGEIRRGKVFAGRRGRLPGKGGGPRVRLARGN